VKLSLNQSQANRTPWLDHAVAGKLHEIAAGLGRPEDSVDFILVDDDFIRNINRDYRGKDSPTDVISFSYIDEASPALETTDDDVAGEVYVSFETLEKEARDTGVDLKNLFLRVGVHGLLHVIGYDHVADPDAQRMEEEERRVLLEHLSPADVDALF
jgi:probable rRNA maturation factor